MSSEREANYVRLMSTYDRSVRRLAMAYERDHALREDLIQEIWLALWLALPSFRGDCAERTFVYRIAHNRGVSHIQQARRGRAETLDDSIPIPDPGLRPRVCRRPAQRREHLQPRAAPASRPSPGRGAHTRGAQQSGDRRGARAEREQRRRSPDSRPRRAAGSHDYAVEERMTSSPDRELKAWIDDWQAGTSERRPPSRFATMSSGGADC